MHVRSRLLLHAVSFHTGKIRKAKNRFSNNSFRRCTSTHAWTTTYFRATEASFRSHHILHVALASQSGQLKKKLKRLMNKYIKLWNVGVLATCTISDPFHRKPEHRHPGLLMPCGLGLVHTDTKWEFTRQWHVFQLTRVPRYFVPPESGQKFGGDSHLCCLAFPQLVSWMGWVRYFLHR